MSAVASPIADLNHRRVAELWDYKFKGEVAYPVLRAEMRTRFPAVSIVEYDVFGNTHGVDEHAVVTALPGRLRSLDVDAVVAGIGC